MWQRQQLEELAQWQQLQLLQQWKSWLTDWWRLGWLGPWGLGPCLFDLSEVLERRIGFRHSLLEKTVVADCCGLHTFLHLFAGPSERNGNGNGTSTNMVMLHTCMNETCSLPLPLPHWISCNFLDDDQWSVITARSLSLFVTVCHCLLPESANVIRKAVALYT